MKNDKKEVLILVFLIVIMGICYILIRIGDAKQAKRDQELLKYSTVSTDISLDDYFQAAGILRIFDNLVNASNTGGLMDVIDKDYLNNHALNKSSIIKYFNPQSFSLKNFIKDIYFSKNKNNKYIFLSTYNRKEDSFKGIISENDINYYLIIMDLNNDSYKVIPLDDINNFDNYVYHYNFTDVTIPLNKNNDITKIAFYEKDLINYYLDYTEYLLFIDDNEVNNHIQSNNADPIEILNILTNVLYNYEKVESDINEYRVTLFNGKILRLAFDKPTDYVISFN